MMDTIMMDTIMMDTIMMDSIVTDSIVMDTIMMDSIINDLVSIAALPLPVQIRPSSVGAHVPTKRAVGVHIRDNVESVFLE